LESGDRFAMDNPDDEAKLKASVPMSDFLPRLMDALRTISCGGSEMAFL